MMNGEVIRGADMLSGRGMFDSEHYCSYVSEQLFKFLGNNSNKKLDQAVAPEDMWQFLNAFEQATTKKQQVIYIRIKRVDDIYRMCRLSVSKRKNGMYEVEIVDIDKACEESLELMEETEKMRYVAAKQEFVMFEYYFTSGETEIYGFNEALKMDFSGDSTYEVLKKFISRDAKEMNESTSPFIFNKTYTIGDAKYTVRGNVILKDCEKYETIGLIIANDEDDTVFRETGNTHDAATGLYNKPHSLMLARKAVNLKKNKQILLAMIDIDNFKLINDTYGHLFGDEVLKKLAFILRESAMNRGFAGRFGGDEFFMCLYDIGTESDLRALLQDIYYKLKKAFADKEINISCSMGIAEYPRNSKDFDILMRKADRGLYIAKYKGKNRYIIYKEHIHGELSEDGKLHEVCMRENISRKQMITGIKDCFIKLVREHSDLDALNQVMERLIQIYGIDGISIYGGDDFCKLYQFGEYSAPITRAEYMNNKNIVNLFTDEGIFCEKVHYLRNSVLEEFHQELKSHNIVTTMQCIIGSKTDVKGVVTFDSEQFEKSWSDEEMSLALILSNVLTCYLKLSLD